MLEPSYVDGPADLVRLADEMKEFARKDPHAEKPGYSKTLEEAKQAAEKPEMVEMVKASPTIRLVIFQRLFPVTLGLSLDQYKDPACWTLSMSMPGGLDDQGKPNIVRVPDPLAGVIAKAFFGEGYQEVAPEGFWKTVRQFEKGL
jgi:hypothetical protein